MCTGYKFNFSFKVTERENIEHLMKIYTKIKEQREKKKEKWKKILERERCKYQNGNE